MTPMGTASSGLQDIIVWAQADEACAAPDLLPLLEQWTITVGLGTLGLLLRRGVCRLTHVVLERIVRELIQPT
jgi:hypothetical protein